MFFPVISITQGVWQLKCWWRRWWLLDSVGWEGEDPSLSFGCIQISLRRRRRRKWQILGLHATRWYGWARGVSGTLKFSRWRHLTKGQALNKKTNAIFRKEGLWIYRWLVQRALKQPDLCLVMFRSFHLKQLPETRGAAKWPAPECSLPSSLQKCLWHSFHFINIKRTKPCRFLYKNPPKCLEVPQVIPRQPVVSESLCSLTSSVKLPEHVSPHSYS